MRESRVTIQRNEGIKSNNENDHQILLFLYIYPNNLKMLVQREFVGCQARRWFGNIVALR
ncbi:hypothetical protein A1OK_10580 [Enterovibrio norvegicus FF-454]|uniref:Uncharacterized protein n=1 Tax=Enterovibrio norvegicus FF-454 TaxID=1185651 RepID=A0A1E5C4D2_9GAMM|nr:hypothetical protein A1OK_10580 [Enterovibrio norvegicus FF-454]